MTDRLNADVVIVGGGVIGCMAAYYLTARGVKPVVVEAQGVATGASGLSGGILTPYSGSGDPGLLSLSRASLGLHSELARLLPEITGIDHGYDLKPYLRCVFTEEGSTRLQTWQAERSAEGFKAEWLTPAQAKSVTPWITGDIIGALKTEIEPTVDSYRLTVSAMQAAQKKGARLVSGRVSGIISHGNKGSGVRLADGSEISSPQTVIATGPWACEAGEWLGYEVPVRPQKGQMVYLDRGFGGHPPLEVALSAWDSGGAVTPKRLTETVVGATRENDSGFSTVQTQDAKQSLIERAAKLAKWIAEVPVVRHTACLRPYPADGKPFVGRAPRWEGVWIASGHWSEGVHYAPLTGRWLADMIADGRSAYDLTAIDAARMAN